MLLILAAITISVVLGEDGIVRRAQISAERTKIENYRDVLEVIGVGLRPDKITEELNTKEYMDRYEAAIKKEKTFEKAKEVKRVDEGTVKVVTEEGYVFEVTDQGVKYLGKQGTNPMPDVNQANIKIDYEPKTPTKNDVKVTISTTLEGYKIEYTTGNPGDESTWKKYDDKTEIIMQTNGNIYARLRNNLEEVTNKYTNGIISNIDKLEPNPFNAEIVESTTSSIKVKGNTTDHEATNEYASSKNLTYYFKIESTDGGKIPEDETDWVPTNGIEMAGGEDAEYTFNGLSQGKHYTVKMKAVDNAENETETEVQTSETLKVPGKEDYRNRWKRSNRVYI